MAQVVVDGKIVEIECCLVDHDPADKYHGRSVGERLDHCLEIVKAYGTRKDPVAQQALAIRLAARDECLYHAEAALFGGACRGVCCEAVDLVEIDQAAA